MNRVLERELRDHENGWLYFHLQRPALNKMVELKTDIGVTLEGCLKKKKGIYYFATNLHDDRLSVGKIEKWRPLPKTTRSKEKR